jgi:LexA-binding, inner membrane-associated putative hydrolase
VFLGHFAVGFSAKRAAPKTSLGTLILAAVSLDVLWPVFLLLRIERVRIDPGNTPVAPLDFESYPWSHSLLLAAVWSAAFAAVYWAIRRYRAGALAAGLCVASHWVLDWVTHRPDLPLAPGGTPRLGLGLWYSRPATVAVEGAMFAAGLAIYARTTAPRDRIGRWALAALVALLVGCYAANLFGPPPPSVPAIAVAGAAGAVLFVSWGYWIDRHREVRSG